MLKLKLQYLGHLMQRVDLLEKTLMLGKIEGKRKGRRISLSFFFFSLSLAIPQSGLLSHVSSLRLPLEHSGPVLTLSNAAHTSLSRPHLLVVDASVWAASLLGVAIRHVICGF